MSSLCDISELGAIALAERISRDTFLYSRRFQNDFKAIVARTYAFSDTQWREVERTITESAQEENE